MFVRRVLLLGLGLGLGCALVLLPAGQAGATYPGTNGDIAFTSPSAAQTQIWTMAPLGGGKALITSPPSANFSPSWSADSSRIVFIATPPSGVQQIFMMNPNGTLRTQVTSGTRNFDDPSISPDGKWIVASSWRSDTESENLWLVKADASRMHRFTKFKADDVGATFSPDGTQVAWTRVRPNGTSDVFIKNVDGAGFHQLTGGNGDDRDADFSPDGTKLVYTHVEGIQETGRLWTMDVDGVHKARFTDNASGTTYDAAVWSPKGDKVAFIREVDLAHTVPDIFLVNYPGGGGFTNLTEGKFEPTDLDWGVG